MKTTDDKSSGFPAHL